MPSNQPLPTDAKALRPAVFLDRDGTLNRIVVKDGVPNPPASVEDLQILPGVQQALDRLRQAGFLLAVVTNQPDVARGTLHFDAAEQINDLLRGRLGLDALLCCYHDDADNCGCRKPRPGMLIDAAQRYGLNLRRSFLVGDRWGYIRAGQLAGCTTVLLRRPYSGYVQADFEAADLPEAAEIILRCKEEAAGEDLRR